jgi:hypothetical protein
MILISGQFFSEGGDDGPEHNRAHRLVNAWEFAKLVKQSAEMGHHVIAVCIYSQEVVDYALCSTDWRLQ